MSYKLKLEIFEGPLDLLLYLIKKNDLNVCDIPIAQVTQQYMEYIEMMQMLNLDIVGDFLVMAATLMQIKSRMLLPPDPSEVAQEEDPRDELVQRLMEYKQFKEIAQELREKESFRQDLFARNVDETETQRLREEAKEVYLDVSLFDLIAAFKKALNKVSNKAVYEVARDEFTVEKKIHDILHLLLEQSQILLTELFGKARSKMEIIVTFMAILELIRLKEIKVIQKNVFGEIEIMRNKENLVPVEDDQTGGPTAS
jgi:segregation and condensation protein A